MRTMWRLWVKKAVSGVEQSNIRPSVFKAKNEILGTKC